MYKRQSLSYGSQKILNDLCFEIEEGQFAVLIGPSGCGKTTTLKLSLIHISMCIRDRSTREPSTKARRAAGMAPIRMRPLSLELIPELSLIHI